MKKLEVQIMGQSYLLGCPENGDARMLDAVSRVDEAMCKIRDVGKIKARDRIAVLAALNLAFELPERHASNETASAYPDSTTPNNFSDMSTTAYAVQLAVLLKRLDHALGSDGQLL
jgi:cell division protein ZapA